MRYDARIGSDNTRSAGASLYDRLERALIALEYALADAREANGPAPERSQGALLSAGEEVQDVLLLLKTAVLGEAAARVRNWG